MISGFIALILGAANIVIVSLVLNGHSLAFIQSERAAFFTVFILSMAMCSIGITNTLQNPSFRVAGFTIGGLIGIVLAALFLLVITGREIPLLGTLRNALILTISLMSVKLLVSTANIVLTFLQGGK